MFKWITHNSNTDKTHKPSTRVWLYPLMSKVCKNNHFLLCVVLIFVLGYLEASEIFFEWD